MCWRCDNPDATDDDYFDLIQAQVDKHGYFVQGVEKDRIRPGFTYTVGLTVHGHPELLVTGMKHRESVEFLGSLAHQLIGHEAPPYVPGEFHLWPDGPFVEVVEVAEPTVHLVMAAGMYGPGIEAVQLVYTDDQGRWPWEVGFRGNQSVLGPRSEAWADQ